MTTKELWKAPDLVPILTYSNLERSIEWFETVFGFRERAEARLTWPGGGRTWIEVGSGLFVIATPTEDQKGGSPAGIVIKVYVDDVDSHFAHAKAEGATIILEPEDAFWGGRRYRALDHEGHEWDIAQRGRDLAASSWKLLPGMKRGVD